jgi:enoyl-[acyl-carrier-protein] reductase (NADH)
MTLDNPRPVLKDKKALVVGIANEHSIAYGCAAAFHELGADQRAPVGERVDINDVGYARAYLATPYARPITGGTVYVDGGVNIMA